jgi:hypothetical protein
MGTWGIGLYDNDDALDLREDFEARRPGAMGRGSTPSVGARGVPGCSGSRR